MGLRKFIVIKPQLFQKILSNTVRNSELTDLEKSLLKVMKNKNLKNKFLTKWLLYKSILNKYKNVQHLNENVKRKSDAVENNSAEKRPLPTFQNSSENNNSSGNNYRKRRVKNSSIQTESPTTVEMGTSTDKLPSKFYDDVYTSNMGESGERESNDDNTIDKREAEEDEIVDFPDRNFDEYLHNLVYEAELKNTPSPKVVRRPSTNNNSPFAVFDNLDTGSVIHIDKDEARRQMYEDNGEQPPTPNPTPKKNKKMNKESVYELRKRTVSRIQSPKKKNSWVSIK